MKQSIHIDFINTVKSLHKALHYEPDSLVRWVILRPQNYILHTEHAKVPQ